MKLPRVMLAAPKSGSGKTLLTCGLLQVLKEDGLAVGSCKCGPDYIDPMFHRRVLGVPATNLDTFFTGEEDTIKLLSKVSGDRDMVVMEGVMGLFDGLGGTRQEGSAYHLAQVTKTPVILVVDVHGMGFSMIPMIAGFLSYDRDHLIQGVILNRISGSFFQTMKPVLERELTVPVVGYFENYKELNWESRHLGLKMPEEVVALQEQLALTGQYFRKTVDVEGIKNIAEDAEDVDVDDSLYDGFCGGADDSTRGARDDVSAGKCIPRLRLAVARDEAFCFYYEENLRLFQGRGVEIVYFSPLRDSCLPENIHGILLGGGYPELYADALSRNRDMGTAVYQAINSGIPSLAECGGFMYLHREMETEDGTFSMVGVIDATVSKQDKLVRFGYVEVEEHTPCFLSAGEKIRGHEFHYFDSTNNGNSCVAKKPTLNRSWQCCYVGDNHWWGFPHLYYGSNPSFVDHFIQQMQTIRDGY